MMRSMYAVLAMTMMSIAACGGNDGGAQKIKASQLVFDPSGPAALKAASSGCLDTETQFLASNVTLDNAALGIGSGNVQDAFGEIAPDINVVAVQTWAITDMNYGGSFAEPITEGTLILHDDGKVDVSGVTGNNSFSFLLNGAASYEIIEDAMILFRVVKVNADQTTSTVSSVFPIIKLTPTKIVSTQFILNAQAGL